MDTKNEDTMVRQIEQNLSNNINDNLFLTGRVVKTNRLPMKEEASFELDGDTKKLDSLSPDYPLVSYDYINTVPSTVSRAEYIRQAREACLRQLSSAQLYSRPYDVNYMETTAQQPEQLEHKKAKVWKLFHDDAIEDNRQAEENSPQEIAAFRALIIRTVCAIVLFLAVFLIDKFDFKIGNMTPTMIKEYVTGNDTLQELEDIIVTWLK